MHFITLQSVIANGFSWNLNLEIKGNMHIASTSLQLLDLKIRNEL